MGEAEIRYAERDGSYLAFTVFGDGPRDIALNNAQCPIDLMWELPQLASFLDALGRMARVIVIDGRGVGASDSLRDMNASRSEETTDDVFAVLDAAGSTRPTLFDMTQGTMTMVAAAHPERVRSLILVNLRASFPELRGLTAVQRTKLAMRLRTLDWLRLENPRVAHDPVLQRWFGRATRLGSSPAIQAQNIEWAAGTNYEAALPSVQVPTLVFHRRDNRVWDIESSRAAAALIPGSQFVELSGAESDIFLGDTAPVLAEIERFLEEPDTDLVRDRHLATVLFTDFVSSTEQLAARGDAVWRSILDRYDAAAARLVGAYRGELVKQLGDGTLATFDGPARAVYCAAAIRGAADELGIAVRAGLHTGEIELRPADVAGMAVHIASRISALAGPNEILVSRTVVDLTQGSGLTFEPRGEYELKGVPGSWPVFAALADR
jgi:class 3 adenylate cyclase